MQGQSVLTTSSGPSFVFDNIKSHRNKAQLPSVSITLRKTIHLNWKTGYYEYLTAPNSERRMFMKMCVTESV